MRSRTVVTTEDFANRAGVGEEPNTLKVSETTSLLDERNGTVNKVTARIPLFLRTGELGHAITPNLTFRSVDASFIQEDDFGSVDGDDPLGPFTRGTASADDVTRFLSFGTMYELLAPALFGDHARNQLSVGGSVRLDLVSRTDSSESDLATFAYDGTTVDSTGGTAASETREMESGLGFNVSAFAAQSFYHDLPNNVTFAYRPRVAIGYTQDPPDPRVTRLVETDVVTDAGGTETTDTVVTTTTEYANRDSTRRINTNVQLPVAVKVHPEGWLSGFSLSGSPLASYTVTVTTEYDQPLAATTIETEDRVAESESTDTTKYSDDGVTRTVTHGWNFDASYQFGIHVPLAENVQLDIGLAANLLNFNGMRIQAIVGL